jgi:2-C-methyl-D-erythritol 2,4-cyclodiphosphate synthase
VAEGPKLLKYIEQMRENICSVLNLELNQVNIKATSTEGMGFIGEGEGMSAYAVVCIEHSDKEFYNKIEI